LSPKSSNGIFVFLLPPGVSLSAFSSQLLHEFHFLSSLTLPQALLTALPELLKQYANETTGSETVVAPYKALDIPSISFLNTQSEKIRMVCYCNSLLIMSVISSQQPSAVWGEWQHSPPPSTFPIPVLAV